MIIKPSVEDKEAESFVEDYIRFHETVTPNLRCPACGQTNFHIQFRNNNANYAFVPYTDIRQKEHKTSDILIVYLIVCDNCQFLFQFAFGQVPAWLKKNPKKAEDAG